MTNHGLTLSSSSCYLPMSFEHLRAPFEDYFGEDIDVSSVKGNASPDLKKHIAVLFRLFRSRAGNGFADSTGEAVAITSIDVEKVGEKRRPRSTVVCECTISEGQPIVMISLSA